MYVSAETCMLIQSAVGVVCCADVAFPPCRQVRSRDPQDAQSEDKPACPAHPHAAIAGAASQCCVQMPACPGHLWAAWNNAVEGSILQQLQGTKLLVMTVTHISRAKHAWWNGGWLRLLAIMLHTLCLSSVAAERVHA